MQPWDFILIEDVGIRRRVKSLFDEANERAAAVYTGERLALYRSLKLEGIMEAPLNLCVTCDRERGGPHVLGRHSVVDTDLFSACLAVQNLWLAARAEGVGVGWVSIIEPAELGNLLGLPRGVVPLAYLCLGYVTAYLPAPELQQAGWRDRLALSGLVHLDRWGNPPSDPTLFDRSPG
jgi:5,6-dimethylbenzimidazole synthase